MDSLSKLKRKRATLRASITRLLETINTEMDSDCPNVDVIDEKVELLQAKHKVVEELDNKIEDIVDEERFDEEINASEAIADNVIGTLARYKSFTKRNSMEKSPGIRNVDGDGRRVMGHDSPQHRDVVGAGDLNVKLPRLEVKKFSGEASQWQGFWSQFDTAIHSNRRLQKGEKLVYLKSYLDGNAARSLMGLQISDANYDVAVELLKQRFGRLDIVVNAHMKKLLQLVPVKSSTDSRGLRKLFDVCEVEIRSLESLGVKTSTYGTLLCPVIMQALPEDISMKYIERKGLAIDWDVDDLLNFLRTQVEVRERASEMLAHGKPKGSALEMRDVDRDQRFEKKRQASAMALQTSSDKGKCVFCRKDHNSVNCEMDPRRKYEKLKKDRRCYMCFRHGHTSTKCHEKECDRCFRRHHKSVCFSKNTVREVDVQQENDNAETVVATTNSRRRAILLQTASAKLATKGEPTVRILLDGGSETSFILEETSRKYRLPVVSEDNVRVFTFGNESPTSTIRRNVKLKLRSFVNSNDVSIEVAETKIITAANILKPGKIVIDELRRRGLQAAETIDAGDKSNLKISVLIGSNYYWSVATGNIVMLTSKLAAVETIFGWCVQGVANIEQSRALSNVLHSTIEETLSSQIKAFWELEAIGIVDDAKCENVKDKEVMSCFENNVHFKDGRYEVSLPWKEGTNKLSPNYEIARRRLGYLVRKFEMNEEFFDRYKAVIEEQIADGIVERVPANSDIEGNVYYIPHQAVIREDKATTKLRVVFDASSHAVGKFSLNDCLDSGPNLVPELLSILMNFRRRRYAFTADIKKAFLQIAVNERDRNALRFLWLKKGWKPGDIVDIEEFRVTRVLFGATCSPFLLAATIKHHIANYSEDYPDVVDRLHKQMYVDDFIGSEATEGDLKRIMNVSRAIMRDANMELTKWSTNSTTLAKQWNFQGMKNIEELPISVDVRSDKVLGLQWNREQDIFSFNVRNIISFIRNKPSTKRTVLQTLSRIYDPLGFVSPFTVRVKILFQQLWEKGLDWDTLFSDVNDWKKWCGELQFLENVEIDRCIEEMEVLEKQIHIFSDASESAYGAVAYLRLVFIDGSTITKFLISKTRVAPLKKLSLPRLELMGAVIASRLKVFLEDKFGHSSIYLWCDAMIVLHWIKGTAKRWKPFVANRIGEIHTSTSPDNWRHCSGRENPADRLTRGTNASDLIIDELWWKGPKWMLKESDYWPNQTSLVSDNDVSNELRKVYVSATATVKLDALFDESKYSRYCKVLRITAWIKRFVNNTRNKERKCGALDVDEIESAECYWFTHIQMCKFGDDIELLKDKKAIKDTSVLIQCNPYVDDYGILRARGRLQYSDIDAQAKYPIIIPRESHIAKLIVEEAHRRVLHLGVQATLNKLRSRYFIPRGRQLVKAVISRCVVCRRYSVKHLDESAPPLPADRASMSMPFTVVGLDFAGPLFDNKGKKVYILLITCATTRAVHLELVTSMNTEATILALRRFISRRGVPSTIYSDNGRTFKRVNLEIQALLNSRSSTTLREFFTSQKIKWKFIVERSPWWGGFWERMVRTVKSTLKKNLGRAALTIEELSTVLTECESVINSRPLTYVYNDHDEPEALTASNFLIGKKDSSMTSTKNCDTNCGRGELLKRWEYRQRLAEHYWRRWQKEYLLELKTSKQKVKSKSSTMANVGDVVLIKEDNMARQQWVLGKIVEIIPGRDGKVRACKVKIPKGSVICRPIQRLFPLEVSSKEDGTSAVSMGGVCCESSTNTREHSRNIGAEDRKHATSTI